MGLGSLKDSAKKALLGHFLGAMARKAEAGEYGPIVQKVYAKSKGYKTYTGLALLAIFGAMQEFRPEFHGRTLDVATGLSTALIGLGLLDKAWRSEAAFPPWFLEAVQRVAMVIAWLQMFAIPAVDPLLDTFAPGCVRCDKFNIQIQMLLMAGSTACMYLNRLVAAYSAPKPEPIQGDMK